MEEHKRAFKGIWIPKEVWQHPYLGIFEKCLWAEIDSLDNEKGCIASNTYLANLMGVTEKHISKTITKLKKYGLIIQNGFDGRTRVLTSIKISCPTQERNQTTQNCVGSLHQNVNSDYSKLRSPIYIMITVRIKVSILPHKNTSTFFASPFLHNINN